MSIYTGNEEFNRIYHQLNDTTDLASYVAILSHTTRIAHPKGFKVSNGGLTTEGLAVATWRWLNAMGDARATNFLNKCIPYNKRFSTMNPGASATTEYQVGSVLYLLKRYDTMGMLDCVNVHLYFPIAKRITDTTSILPTDFTGINEISDFVKYYCPTKQITSNEFGYLINNADLVKNTNRDFVQNRFYDLNYYNDGSGEAPVLPLVDNTGTVTSFGNTFLLNYTQ